MVGLPEAGLVLIYSGIDTLGLLAAAPEIEDATGETFKGWCKKYLLARLQSIDGKPLEAVDLWAARCGVLHTSAPVSTALRQFSTVVASGSTGKLGYSERTGVKLA